MEESMGFGQPQKVILRNFWSSINPNVLYFVRSQYENFVGSFLQQESMPNRRNYMQSISNQ